MELGIDGAVTEHRSACLQSHSENVPFVHKKLRTEGLPRCRHLLPDDIGSICGREVWGLVGGGSAEGKRCWGLGTTEGPEGGEEGPCHGHPSMY